MRRKYVFADEAGCFTFNRRQNVSKYFIIATITTEDWETPTLGLQRLRHDLLKDQMDLGDFFHCTSDKQAIRDRVFAEIDQYDFKIQATICEKAKAQPQVRSSKARFYRTPWFYHCKFGLAPHLEGIDEVVITAASIGTKKEKLSFTSGLSDVMSKTIDHQKWDVDFRPCSSDPCLQIADYCAWAIQRKWERNDTRSYDLISEKISREFDLWAHGTTLYY